MADIFVSYTSSDPDWAFWIGQELEKLGHIPHLHEWEISGGGDIAKWMLDRADKADQMLCVVSETYLTKDYSSWERNAAQWTAVMRRPNYMLPVFIEDCEAPILLAPIKRCDLAGLSEEDARARLAAFLTPAKKPEGPVRFPGAPAAIPVTIQREPAAFPGARFALSNIPIRVPLHFLGREEALKAIEINLKQHEGRVAITALHGLRGVGKTTLAAAYAERHRGNYRATWWIRAQTETSTRADLVSLGIRLGWVGAEDKEEPALATVMERLRHEGESILLIYDNAIDANTLTLSAARWPCPRSRHIQRPCLRSRHIQRPCLARHRRNGPNPPVAETIGADYLIARTGRTNERKAAEALSEALGGLPLAHEQAAAYCERLELSLSAYQKRFDAAPARLLDDTRHAPAEYHDGLTVAKTFAAALDLRDLGDRDGGRMFFERALLLLGKLHGRDYPLTGTSLTNLARVLTKIGRADQVEPLFQRAIAIDTKALGPDFQRYASQCAGLLLETGRSAQALSLVQAALAVHEKALGENHPWTEDSARVTADALDALGRAWEAAALRARYNLPGNGL